MRIEMVVETMPSLGEATFRFGSPRLYRDAWALATSNIANAALGLVFWAMAARLVPPERLGIMTAVLAVIVSTGVVIASGIGDAYTALLPAVGDARAALYHRGQRLFYRLTLLSGVGAALATISLLPEVRGSLSVAVLVVAGVLAWASITVQNSTLLALGRARWLPATNGAASVGKLGLLPLLVITIGWHAVELSYLLSAVVIVAVVQRLIVHVIDSGKDLPTATIPEPLAAATFNKFVAQTVAASALSYGAITLTPFLVTSFADPKQGALFALALSIVQALDFVCAALAASLVVHASSAPEHGGAMARAVLMRIALLATGGSVAIVGLTPIVLRMLNPQYGAMEATEVIAALCVGAIVRSGFTVWASLQKSRRDMKPPILVNAVAVVVLLAPMPYLCGSHGALGGAFALLVAQLTLSAGAAAHVLISRRRGGVATKHGTAQAA